MALHDPERTETLTEMVRGLVYTHNRANANTAQVHEAQATVEAVVDLLVERGVLDREAVQARRQAVAERLRREYFERGMGVALQEFGVSKYRFPGGAQIDCEARLPLCKAACCKLPLALSREDVQEGIVRWELGRPYMIAHGRDHYCAHLNRETQTCGVYANRPIPCRGYDCRQDRRIWLDFEHRVINPLIDDPEWPACLEEQATNDEHAADEDE